MLHKCANPVCCAQFRYLHEGKVFEVETQYSRDHPGGADGTPAGVKGDVERYWLCDQCAPHIVLRFDARRGLVTVSSLQNLGRPVATALPQLSPGASFETARVLIRPLDLTFDSLDRRKAAGELNVRRGDEA